MNKFLFLLMILGLNKLAKSQADSIIYDIAIKNSDFYFAKIDPLAGIVTNISSTAVPLSYTGIATIDPFSKIYYFINWNSGTFTGVDIATGNIISNPIITNANGTYFNEFIFNCSDSTIYGLAIKNSDFYFAKIDPATGVVTNISTSSFPVSYTGMATLDPFNNIYYFINSTFGTFTGIDISTGSIISDPIVTNSIGGYFNAFIFNCSDSNIYGLAIKNSDFYFAKINPTTGVVTNISISSTPLSYTGIATLDPFNNIYYFVNYNSGTYTGINVVTGNILSNPIITNSNGTDFNGFIYNNNCCSRAVAFVDEIIIDMPNVFTPNQDGNNDTFHPNALKGISNTRLYIYNRWGDLLFETTNLIQGWDGKTKGKDANNGTYFWMLEYSSIKNENSRKKGFLTLIK